MDDRRWAALGATTAVTGGAAWALVPTLDTALPGLLDFAWIPALVLLGAVAGLPSALPALTESPGRTGLGLVGGGLAFVALGAGVRLWALTLSPPQLGVAIGFGLAGIGLLVAALGSAVVGVVLWRSDGVPGPVAAVFAVSLPLDPLLNAAITPPLGVGVSVYGVAWVALGIAVVRSVARNG